MLAKIQRSYALSPEQKDLFPQLELSKNSRNSVNNQKKAYKTMEAEEVKDWIAKTKISSLVADDAF